MKGLHWKDPLLLKVLLKRRRTSSPRSVLRQAPYRDPFLMKSSAQGPLQQAALSRVRLATGSCVQVLDSELRCARATHSKASSALRKSHHIARISFRTSSPRSLRGCRDAGSPCRNCEKVLVEIGARRCARLTRTDLLCFPLRGEHEQRDRVRSEHAVPVEAEVLQAERQVALPDCREVHGQCPGSAAHHLWSDEWRG